MFEKIVLMVSKSRKQIMVSSWIIPKNEQNSLSWAPSVLRIVRFVCILEELRTPYFFSRFTDLYKEFEKRHFVMRYPVKECPAYQISSLTNNASRFSGNFTFQKAQLGLASFQQFWILTKLSGNEKNVIQNISFSSKYLILL